MVSRGGGGGVATLDTKINGVETKEPSYAPSKAETAARLQLDRDLERFFTARVGIRLLTEHYLAVRGDIAPLIDTSCNPGEVVSAAADDVNNWPRGPTAPILTLMFMVIKISKSPT